MKHASGSGRAVGIPREGSHDLKVNGCRLRLTRLEKVLWPRAKFTKGQMLAYYAGAAPRLLPHLEDRPLTLGRWPDGVEEPGFGQTECRGCPEWMRTVPVRIRSGKVRNHCVVDDLASLLWVANQNAIELHAPLWRASDPERPDALVLDLDPGPGASLLDCGRVALRLREALAEKQLDCFPKSSGASGLHLHAPVSGASFAETKSLARELARRMADERPADVTASSRAHREGMVLVDWAQNDRSRTLIAPYSLRATSWPAIAAPLRWEQLTNALAMGIDKGLRTEIS